MNKGTAIVGFLLSFLAGAGLVWGVAESSRNRAGEAMTAEAHANSPIPISAEDPVWGNPAAPVTIVEISDLECPFCARVLPTLARVQKDYGPDKVRLVWKHSPSPSHPNARPAAEAGATVLALGGDFRKFNELAFASQKSLTAENFASWAVAAGVDSQKFKAAVAAKQYASKVDRDLALVRQIGMNGTPDFRINGKALIGAQPFDKFKQVIDEQLAAAELLAKSGLPRSKLSLELTRQNFKTEAAKAPRAEPRPAPEDTTPWKVPVLEDDPVQGPADALVTIVEFSDFQCPFCARVEPTLQRLRDEYKEDLRIVWKDSPLPSHPRARPAAYLARLAYEQKGNPAFWAAHAALFGAQQDLEDPALLGLGKQLGLSEDRIRAALHEDKYRARIERGADLARDFSGGRTPAFFINGRRLIGAQPYEKFKELVDAGLENGKRLLSQGVRRDQVFRELMKAAQGAPEPEKKQVQEPGPSNPFKGPAKAKVVIQEFSDFQCPFCSRVGATLEQVLKEYPKDVKLVWRHLPASFHPHAALAAEAAQEAFEQAGNQGFWKYHDRLFGNQSALKRPDLERYAQELGLDMARFRQALDTRAHKERVERDAAVGQKAAIIGTPGFVINGYFVSGAQPFAEFDRAIQRALKGS